MASSDASNKKMKGFASVAENVGNIEASSPRYQLRGLSKPSGKAVNNDKAVAANVGEGNSHEENIRKKDMLPSPVLDPKGVADVNLVRLTGQQLIGRKVKIWWSKQEMFHRGRIIDFDEEGRMHLVHYDNNIHEFVDLQAQRWQLVKEKSPDAVSSNAMPSNVVVDTSHTLKRKVKDVMTNGGNNKKLIKTKLSTNEEVMTNGGKDKKVTKTKLSPNREVMTNGGKDKNVNKTKLSSNEDRQLSHKAATTAGPKMVDSHYELVDVNGYEVNASIAPTLRSIFLKHGDIARDCCCELPRIRSYMLQEVCSIVQKLESSKSVSTPSQVREMTAIIRDAAKVNLHVSWLQRFLEGISQTEEVAAASSRAVEAARIDMEARRREFVEAEKRWRALELVHEKIESDAAAAKQVFKGILD